MKAIITVVGKDQVGIIAKVCTLLADHKVNVLDINQSIMDGYFNMFMNVKLKADKDLFETISKGLEKLAVETGIEITFQRTELFDEMYKISRRSL